MSVLRLLFLVVASTASYTGRLAAQTIRIWPGKAPGSEHWTQKERTFEKHAGRHRRDECGDSHPDALSPDPIQGHRPAMVASGAVLQADSAGRPNFAAFIYGAPFGVMPAIPAQLPPLFMAWAQDDRVALDIRW